jgi:NADH:flavin oxidoreductases, Old Yellow Enzyme family
MMPFRKAFSGAYVGNNKMTLDLAEKELAAGHADLFAFGRPFIANPDLVARLASGAPLAEAPEAYYYGGDSTGYSDWPGMNGPVQFKAA